MKRLALGIVLIVGLVSIGALTTLLAQDEASPYDDALQDVVDLFTEGDLALIETTFTRDITIHYLTGEPDREGAESLTEWVMFSRTIFPDFTLTIDDYIVQDDTLAARWTVNGTHSGEVPGIPPTGNDVVFRGMMLLQFEDGKVVEWWHADDQLSILTQLGVIPPMPVPPQQ